MAKCREKGRQKGAKKKNKRKVRKRERQRERKTKKRERIVKERSSKTKEEELETNSIRRWSGVVVSKESKLEEKIGVKLERQKIETFVAIVASPPLVFYYICLLQRQVKYNYHKASRPRKASRKKVTIQLLWSFCFLYATYTENVA